MEWCKEKSSFRKFVRFQVIKQVDESKINGTNNFEKPYGSLFEIIWKNWGKYLYNKLLYIQL